jgi:signal transduction histidine kinase
VVTNLLGNAITYNRPGGSIEVTLSEEDGAAVLRVADTGIGIAAENLPHLFERFYRVDPARSRAAGGSGLGLAICKSIVEGHGGTIDVESTAGVGTTVTVRLPERGGDVEA